LGLKLYKTRGIAKGWGLWVYSSNKRWKIALHGEATHSTMPLFGPLLAPNILTIKIPGYNLVQSSAVNSLLGIEISHIIS
jgi:hypothetical protein